MAVSMKLSPEGTDFLKRQEGAIQNTQKIHIPYFDVAAFRTVGYGHKLTPSEVSSGKIILFDQNNIKEVIRFNDGITEEQATRILQKDVGYSEYCVNRDIAIPLKQNEFDALVSLVFNIGTNAFRTSTLRKVVNTAPENNPDEYARAVEFQFKRWTYAGGRIVPGLVTRRGREARLFTMGKYTTG